MPLENLHHQNNSVWALWKIVEEEDELASIVAPHESPPGEMTNTLKRLEFLAARVLIARLLQSWDLKFSGLTKNEFGKPFLKNYTHEVSLSHSYPYVAAIIHKSRSAGIDLEQPKPKLLRVAHRVLHPAELVSAGEDVVKHCIYWCAKESLVKIHGKKDLVFAENLRIDAFSLAKQGKLIGRIIVDSIETAIALQYYVEENFVVVLNED